MLPSEVPSLKYTHTPQGGEICGHPREGLQERAGVLQSCWCLRSDSHAAGRLPLPAHTWWGKPRRGDEVWVASDVWGEVEGGQMKVQG